MSYSYSFSHLQDTLMNVKAIRHFVSTEQKQEIYNLQNQNKLSVEYFTPQLLSSSFSAKQINTHYNDIRKESNLEPIVIKFAANNPKNPDNKANQFEQRLIERFNKKEIKEYKEIKYNDEGKKVMYYALPTKPLTNKCMRCHSDPSAAPQDLVKLYGDKNGFHEKLGYIKAIISTEYPLTDTDNFIYKSTFLLSFVTFLILLVFAFFYLKFSKKIVHKNNELLELNNTLEEKIALEMQTLTQTNKELEIYKRIIDSVDVGATICTWNPERSEFGVSYVNNTFTKMTGYSQEEIFGKNLKLLQGKDTNQEASVIMHNALVERGSCEVEIKNYKKDGSLFYNFLTLSPIHDSDGQIRSYIGIQHDITGFKQNEQKQMQQNKLASLGEMMNNIAHHWRQPLSLISTLSTSLELKKEHNLINDDDLLDGLQTINKNIQYLSKTIDDFREFLDSNTQLRKFTLKELIEDFLKLTEAEIVNHNIKTVLNFDENLEITSYKQELIQICISIFKNAKDALEHNTFKLFVINITYSNSSLIIEFQDNGNGIEPTIMNKIFEPYFTTKHNSQGTGLGLSNVHNLITQLFNGTIEASNTTFEYKETQYCGALFRITLPI